MKISVSTKKSKLTLDGKTFLTVLSIVLLAVVLILFGERLYHTRRIPQIVPRALTDGWNGDNWYSSAIFRFLSPFCLQLLAYWAGLSLARKTRLYRAGSAKLRRRTLLGTFLLLSAVLSGLWFYQSLFTLFSPKDFTWGNLFLPVSNALIIFPLFLAVKKRRDRRAAGAAQ